MADFSRLMTAIKKSAVGAVEAGDPVEFLFGTLTKIDPFTITIEQKISFIKEFFVKNNLLKNLIATPKTNK